ncbi:hypothetical protein MHH52_07750 [Paenibacillus sp. FSL K6-0276]|uniref:hypothetical protein n=1 Tax=Paenibacillus sp. FSL K6-0276 TaxID=2921450 RepID=UPI0030EB2012
MAKKVTMQKIADHLGVLSPSHFRVKAALMRRRENVSYKQLHNLVILLKRMLTSKESSVLLR